MSKTNNIVACKKSTSNLQRARFGPGMLLHHEDLEQLNTYTRDLSRLMFKSLFGCGVICGLVVRTDSKCGKIQVSVESGVALGCLGDPVYVPDSQTLVLDENCDPNMPGPLWVVLCGTVKCCAPRNAICSDEDEAHSECTREREGFEIRVMREPPNCICGCPEPTSDASTVKETDCKCVDPKLPCYQDHYEGKCGCNCDECSDCDCKCIVLARLHKKINGEQILWLVDHRVRRFIRPVLMRDPRVEQEENERKKPPDQLEADAAVAAAAMPAVPEEAAPPVPLPAEPLGSGGTRRSRSGRMSNS